MNKRDGRNAGRLKRRTFLAASLLAASASACAVKKGAVPSTTRLFTVLTPRQYNYAQMMAKLRIRNPHKQVFCASNSVARRGSQYAELYAHMQFAMNGYNLSLPPGRGKLATLGVVAGLAVVLSLNDAMWEKYAIGRRFDLADTNVYYRAKSSLDVQASPNDPTGLYQDWSAEAVLARGGWFMACHNALASIASQCSAGGASAQTALEEMANNLLPGFTLVPAGVTAIQLAQEYGWKLYTLT
jgi:hypothetical protein